MGFSSCVKAGYGCLVKCLALVGLLVVAWFLVVTVALVLVAKFSGGDVLAYGEGAALPECEKPLAKKWMCGTGDEDAPEVVYVSLKGEISDALDSSSPFSRRLSSYSRALHEIRVATRDAAVCGLILKLDTPGGSVTDSDIMAEALRQFKAAGEDRFVLVQMGDMCCSGGYYIATAADFIMAYPTTLTGSIGVILSGLNAAELAKKIGVRSVVVASGANKALLDPLEPVNPEHVAILKRPVEQDYERFVSLVARGRNLPVDAVKKIADGRVLSATDAKESRLVDALGYDEDVWAKAAELAKANEIRIYRYDRPFFWDEFFFGDVGMTWGRSFLGGVMTGLGAPAPSREYRLR